MVRPVLYVLAGVNGAGKSSVGGYLLTRAGLAWYNPDDFARALVQTGGMDVAQANSQAWQEGMRRLRRALVTRTSFACETTLGGRTLPMLLAEATRTHDVMLWYCGLTSVELHLSRVALRVSRGGHDIPTEKIQQRWVSSVQNLVGLMPLLAGLRVYDNSATVDVGLPVPEPWLLLEMAQGRRRYPRRVVDAEGTPDWAKPVLEAAFELDPPGQG